MTLGFGCAGGCRAGSGFIAILSSCFLLCAPFSASVARLRGRCVVELVLLSGVGAEAVGSTLGVVKRFVVAAPCTENKGHVLDVLGAIVVHELRHRSGEEKGLDYRFSLRVKESTVRHYRVMADGELALELCVGFGYDREEFLCEVTVFVKKMHKDVPDSVSGIGVDVVAEMVELVTSDLLQEHDGRQVDFVEWEAIMEPPLQERKGMRGVLRIGDVYQW
ncbi:hypothetical protein CBR_g36693 [Chara braunii]|uniref:Uncharacterized protein n=1 Tax=Chara braunii TaxID=69332 RepID=A0A388LL64_CHABU|nr:hypothetical protein CBR_g36693 [Chara braunii]|eukprot:GBG83076.1 hypothetical protein CBR_g36693 [Chara braunii]